MADTEQKTKQHFNLGHLKLIAGSVAVILLITWVKGGFSFGSALSKNSPQKKVLTYEEVKKQVEAENEPKIKEALAQLDITSNEQIKQLDPSAGGQVLGASTEEFQNFFEDSNKVLSQQILDQIKIESIVPDSDESLKTYASKIKFVENSFNGLELLSNLNSDDTKILMQNSDNAKVLIAALAKIPVPEKLKEYHKYKMLFYLSISRLSEIISGDRSSEEVDNTTQIFFSTMQKIEAIEQVIYEQNQVTF